jgi:asparagine synthase (glutamine-hydrolysing)
MAFSIESRVPFLDYRLVEFVFSIPTIYKINKGWTKYILRKSMKGILPEKIRCRKDKMGFVTPQDTWLKEIEGDVRKILNNSFSKRGYLNPNQIPLILEDYYKGNNSLGKLVWKMFCLELWFSVFFDKN